MICLSHELQICITTSFSQARYSSTRVRLSCPPAACIVFRTDSFFCAKSDRYAFNTSAHLGGKLFAERSTAFFSFTTPISISFCRTKTLSPSAAILTTCFILRRSSFSYSFWCSSVNPAEYIIRNSAALVFIASFSVYPK